MRKLYRKDLENEDVNVVGKFENNKWTYSTESVSLSQFVNLSNHAVVIGNGKTGNEFDLTRILPHRESTSWGETGDWKYKRQMRNFYTYGCNAIYRNFKPDFVVATGDNFIKEIAESTYCNSNVVYASTKYLEKYSGKFNIIPQNPELNAGAMAAYLAAFDGHKKVYMLGFDGIDNPLNNYNVYAGTANYPPADQAINEEFWNRSLDLVMKTYNDTEFIRVCPTAKFRQPEMWKYNLNYRQIDFRQFVVEADI